MRDKRAVLRRKHRVASHVALRSLARQKKAARDDKRFDVTKRSRLLDLMDDLQANHPSSLGMTLV